MKGQIDEIERQIPQETASVRASVRAEVDAAALREIAARVIDTDFIDAVEKAERERKEREALEWAAAEVVAGDDDMKGDD